MPTVTRRSVLPSYLSTASEYFHTPYPGVGSIGDTLSRQQSTSSFTLGGVNPISRKLIENVFTSVSTPGFYVKKKINVQWIPAKYKLSPPRVPRFNPPVLPKINPFPRNSSEKYKSRVLQKFKTRLAKATKRRQQYINQYNVAYSRYLKRKERYEHYLKLQATGIYRYRRMRSTEKVLVRNPYNRTITFDFGVVGYSSEMKTSSTENYLTAAKDGAFCYYKGYNLYRSVPYFYALPPDPSITLNTLSAAESRAIRKLYSRLNDQTVHVGNIVAERAQTFSLISGIVSKIIAMKHGDFSFISANFGKGGLKKISNNFLAFKFGVEPLINDVYSAVEALKKLSSSQQTEKVIVRVGASVTNSDSRVTSTSTRTSTTTLTETVKVSYSLEYKTVNSASSTLQQLGLLNPAEIAWEMMPWSFVVDWFLPIGKYITSFSADAGLEFVGGTKTVVTTKYYQTVINEPKHYFGTNNSQHATLFLQGSRRVETKVRTVLSGAPKPVLPDFKNPLSATHLLESLALLVQKVKR